MVFFDSLEIEFWFPCFLLMHKYYLHDWPGAYGNMDVDATELIWAFFAAVGEE